MPPTAWTRRGRGEALGCAATQYIQLVSKRDYLSLVRTPRPVEIQEDPPEEIENLEHPAFIARFGRSGQADGICGTDNSLHLHRVRSNVCHYRLPSAGVPDLGIHRSLCSSNRAFQSIRVNA